jgi:hypothetical protein
MKSALNGKHICDVTDISKNAKEELKKISPNGFQNVSNAGRIVPRELYLK